MALDASLLKILACPQDKGPLYYLEDEQALYNPRLKLRYRIDQDIPVMLIEEAVTADDQEHLRIMDLVKAQSLALSFDLGTTTAAPPGAARFPPSGEQK